MLSLRSHGTFLSHDHAANNFVHIKLGRYNSQLLIYCEKNSRLVLGSLLFDGLALVLFYQNKYYVIIAVIKLNIFKKKNCNVK